VPANPVVWCAPQPAVPTCQGTGSSVRVCPSLAGVTSAPDVLATVNYCPRGSRTREASHARAPQGRHPIHKVGLAHRGGRYPTLAGCAPGHVVAPRPAARARDLPQGRWSRCCCWHY
jgi:hypothetical protein